MKKEKFEGVLIGLVICEHGEPFVSLSIDGSQTELPIKAALILLEQLETILIGVGAIEEEDEIPGEKPLCH